MENNCDSFEVESEFLNNTYMIFVIHRVKNPFT
jgi:hypothetical protein